MKPYIVYLLSACLAMLISGCSTQLHSDIPQEPDISYSKPVLSSNTSEPTIPETVPDQAINIEPGSYLLTYTDANTANSIDYCLFIPQNVHQNMPLIIFLHGDGEVGKPEKLLTYGIWNRMSEIYGDEYPFVGLSPCTPVATWTSPEITQITKHLIEYIVEQWFIDTDRILITGHSRGAIGVWHMVNLYGDYFAGAVPVSCGTDEALDYQILSQVPVLGVVGTEGTYESNYKRAMQKITDTIEAAGGNAELLIIDGMHHNDSSSKAYSEDVFNWMLERNRSENNEKIQRLSPHSQRFSDIS